MKKPPTDEELLEFVTLFRKRILKGKGPKGKCFMVCSPLEPLLSTAFDIEVSTEEYLIDGKYSHWCLLLWDGRILDPTASQFNFFKKMPEIYLGEKPEWYENVI